MESDISISEIQKILLLSFEIIFFNIVFFNINVLEA